MNKNDKNTYIQELKDLLLSFRDERDWKQFHSPKYLAEALSVEAGELLELFLWKNKEEIEDKIKSDPDFKTRVEEELADVINYCICFANVTDIDIFKISVDKTQKNKKKYPIEKAKGSSKKHNEL